MVGSYRTHRLLSTNRLDTIRGMDATTRDAEATKRRLLTAASAEFAAHGLAGARVDRIARQAGVNKQLIYAYFGSKDDLFDTVIAERCGVLAERVPFEAKDIPGYVGRLFAYVGEDPEIYRLVAWAALERPDTVATFERESYHAKLAAIAAGQRAGTVDATFAPADLLAMAMGLAASWFSASEAIRRFDSDDPMSAQRREQFRRAAVEAAARLLRPG
jgi:AcrR family transcriptional regulator